MKKGNTHSILIGAFFVVVFGALFFFFSQMGGDAQLTGAQVIEFSPSVVTVLDVSPGTVYQGATRQLNITGVDFNSSAVLFIENVSILSTIVVSDSLIEANVSVPITAVNNSYDVAITQDNESSTLPAGLNIREGPFRYTPINVTPADGYINSSPGLNVVNLTYNLSTWSGIDPSLVSIVEGYIELTNLNTSSVLYLNLANWTNSGNVFTLQFDEHNYTEDGSYLGEIYLNVSFNGTTVEREYYSYLGVGGPTCTMIGPCTIVGTVGILTTYVINMTDATLPILGCAFLTPVAGCSVAPGPGAACTISCTAPAAGVFSAGLVSNATGSFCIPFPFAGGLPCTFTFTAPPPPPSTGGGSGGGTNSYPGNAICPQYCKDPKYSHVSICQNPPCVYLSAEQPAQTTQPVVSAPVPKPVIQSKPVVQSVVEQKAVEVSLPQQSPVQELRKPMPPLPMPVEQQSSGSSAVLTVVALLAIVGGLVYWQFFYKHKRK